MVTEMLNGMEKIESKDFFVSKKINLYFIVIIFHTK